MKRRNDSYRSVKLCMFPAVIVLIAVIIMPQNSHAQSTFSKSRALGVMATAVKKEIAVSWEPVKGASGYLVYEAVRQKDNTMSIGAFQLAKKTKKHRCVLGNKEPGRVYYYYIRAYRKQNGNIQYAKSSQRVSTTVPLEGVSTIKNFLQTAIAPVGSTMYVWGGGWNRADTAAGKDAKHVGLSSKWRVFAKNKDSSYNYNQYRYQIHNGLDCSGYVGWCIYNVLHTKDGKKGYVYKASKQAKKFSGFGFGDYCPAKEITDYRAGDIMSSTCQCCGHVWIVVGQCEDGSVVLLHSSPCGVQLCGTTTPSGTVDSSAYRLAKKYMKQYYSEWYEKYPRVNRGSSYLTHYGQMRWTTKGEDAILSDPDGYQNMEPEEILRDLFGRGNK